MKRFFKDFFTYTRGERNGILVLIFLLFGLIIANLGLEYFVRPAQSDFSAQKEKLDSLYQLIQKAKSDSAGRSTPTELFAFNPDTLSKQQWRKLGVSSKTAEIIQNYKEEGGRFETKQDLRKIYGLSEKKYRQLKPYIQLPDKQKVFTQTNSYSESDTSKVFTTDTSDYNNQNNYSTNYTNYKAALNLADSAQLEKVYGIGPAFASRIVEYRELLGGYIDKRQLLELYALDSAHFERIKPNVFIQDTGVQKININTDTVEELGKHPYIRWNIAYIINNYKKQHGPFEKLEELKKIHLINDSIYREVKPYLKVE